MTDFKTFSNQIRKAGSKPLYKITGSKKISDYHRYHNLRYDKIEIHLYRKIYSHMTDLIIQYLMDYHSFKLPCGVGKLILTDYDYYVKFEDGKVKTNRPIDWYKTLKLWYEDEECKRDKTIVRLDVYTGTKISFQKKGSLLKNHRLYSFEFTRKLRKQLNNRYR